MGRIFAVELEGRCYRCKFCQTHLALAEDLLSKAFHCRHGKAYLFKNVVNITVGELEEKLMLSGLHTVADIFCCCCGQIIGWKYVISLSLSLSLYLSLSLSLYHSHSHSHIHLHACLIKALTSSCASLQLQPVDLDTIVKLLCRSWCKRRAKSTNKESLFLKEEGL